MDIQGSNHGKNQEISDLRQRFEAFQTTEKDSSVTRALKSIKRHFSTDYKSIKSQLAKTLGKENISSISDRRAQKVSADQVRTFLSQYDGLQQAPTESVPSSRDDDYMFIGPQGLARQNNSQPSVDYKVKFNNLASETKQVLANQETYQFDQIHGGARFSNILPPVKTAVHTLTDQPMNANYVFNNSYIATQAPLIGAKDKDQNSIPAFFSMIKNSDSDTVVNLTGQADEKGDLKSQYWPDQGHVESYQYGNETVAVNTMSVTSEAGYDIVKLYIQETIDGQWPLTDDGEAKGKETTVFHFKEWPDHGVPKGEQLGYYKNFKKTVESHDGSPQKIVHCRAGVGRTGSFITESEIKKEIDNGNITEANLEQTINNIILQGRTDRGPSFVQTDSQYQLIMEEAKIQSSQTGPLSKFFNTLNSDNLNPDQLQNEKDIINILNSLSPEEVHDLLKTKFQTKVNNTEVRTAAKKLVADVHGNNKGQACIKKANNLEEALEEASKMYTSKQLAGDSLKQIVQDSAIRHIRMQMSKPAIAPKPTSR
ncbi:tyrosine-protein phosphatase [Endozoicomonas ascidiicola]|uniref:tyrosine-protein phosphatase n=1 Tax=Endozoicomonas ascidiicola TaxID=1698521 RepID=UPI00082CD502|nr:tyrosine-protein phosphatase [Endozoicomonas ascidiicola]